MLLSSINNNNVGINNNNDNIISISVLFYAIRLIHVIAGCLSGDKGKGIAMDCVGKCENHACPEEGTA